MSKIQVNNFSIGTPKLYFMDKKQFGYQMDKLGVVELKEN